MLNHKRIGAVTLFAVLTLSDAGNGQVVAPPPAVPPPTLWSFLGIPQGCRKVHGALFNRHGNHPGLEKKLPLKALNDPSFLHPDAPLLLKKAAEVKIAEDLAKQKIKAVKYLTKIGCGCYDADKMITKALQEAMGDCTEKVRLATVEAITEAAQGQCCSNCGQVCCCNEDIMKTLARLAFERDEFGCYEEPSERVRQAASAALEVCCPGTGPVEEEMPEPDGGPELPGQEPDSRPERAGDPESTPSADDEQQKKEEPPKDPNSFATELNEIDLQTAAPIVNMQPPLPIFAATEPQQYPTQTSHRPVVELATDWQLAKGTAAASQAGVAFVLHVDKSRGMAHVHFPDNFAPQVGSQLAVLQETERGKRLVGRVKVFESFPGSANVRGVDIDFDQLRQGDQIAPVRNRGTNVRHVSHRATDVERLSRKTLSSVLGIGQKK